MRNRKAPKRRNKQGCRHRKSRKRTSNKPLASSSSNKEGRLQTLGRSWDVIDVEKTQSMSVSDTIEAIDGCVDELKPISHSRRQLIIDWLVEYMAKLLPPRK